MSGRIHRYRWQLCAGPEGGCAQAAENRYGTQPLDDVPFPRMSALKKTLPSVGNSLTLTVMSNTAMSGGRSHGPNT